MQMSQKRKNVVVKSYNVIFLAFFSLLIFLFYLKDLTFSFSFFFSLLLSNLAFIFQHLYFIPVSTVSFINESYHLLSQLFGFHSTCI